jgi:hypothetical protein
VSVLAGDGDLGDAAGGGQRLPGLGRRSRSRCSARRAQLSPISSTTFWIDHGVCSAGMSTTQLPAASAGASFQAAMQDGKFHGMIWPTTPAARGSGRPRCLVDLAIDALLARGCAGEVAEVVDGERQVGGQSSRGPAFRCPGLGDGEGLEVVLDRGRRSCSGCGRSGARCGPRRWRRRARVERRSMSAGGAAGDLGERLAVARREVLEDGPRRVTHSPPM